MRRRALLGAVGTSVIAGCLDEIVHFGRDGPQFVIDADPVPDGLPATLSATVLTGATTTHPPRIRVTFEYTGDQSRTVRFNYPGPFADTLGTAQDGSKLVLQYKANTDNHHDDCWWARQSNGSVAVERDRFDTGERTHVEWAILTHESMDSCYPSGRYRFEDEYLVDGRRYEWGFYLDVR